jgi:hypothetical protein
VPDIRFHNLHHSSASLAILAGVELKVLTAVFIYIEEVEPQIFSIPIPPLSVSTRFLTLTTHLTGRVALLAPG